MRSASTVRDRLERDAIEALRSTVSGPQSALEGRLAGGVLRSLEDIVLRGDGIDLREMAALAQHLGRDDAAALERLSRDPTLDALPGLLALLRQRQHEAGLRAWHKHASELGEVGALPASANLLRAGAALRQLADDLASAMHSVSSIARCVLSKAPRGGYPRPRSSRAHGDVLQWRSMPAAAVWMRSVASRWSSSGDAALLRPCAGTCRRAACPASRRP